MGNSASTAAASHAVAYIFGMGIAAALDDFIVVERETVSVGARIPDDLVRPRACVRVCACISCIRVEGQAELLLKIYGRGRGRLVV